MYKAMATTRKYKKASCHTTKSAAKKKANAMRRKGLTAQVRGKCVYSAGKRKKVRLRTGQVLYGTRKRRRRA